MSGFPYHWVRHDIQDGVCRRCAKAFEETGIVCCRMYGDTTDEDMRFLGDLAWASDCA